MAQRASRGRASAAKGAPPAHRPAGRRLHRASGTFRARSRNLDARAERRRAPAHSSSNPAGSRMTLGTLFMWNGFGGALPVKRKYLQLPFNGDHGGQVASGLVASLWSFFGGPGTEPRMREILCAGAWGAVSYVCISGTGAPVWRRSRPQSPGRTLMSVEIVI